MLVFEIKKLNNSLYFQQSVYVCICNYSKYLHCKTLKSNTVGREWKSTYVETMETGRRLSRKQENSRRKDLTWGENTNKIFRVFLDFHALKFFLLLLVSFRITAFSSLRFSSQWDMLMQCLSPLMSIIGS